MGSRLIHIITHKLIIKNLHQDLIYFYWPEAKKRSLAQAKNALFAFASLGNKSFLPLRAVSASVNSKDSSHHTPYDVEPEIF